jgi:hypothetical protein
MGRRLDGFDIVLEFDANGDVRTTTYVDRAGCGHTQSFYLSDHLDEVVQYHLHHYALDHAMTPPAQCPATVRLMVDERGRACNIPLQCTNDNSCDGNHVYRRRQT